MELDTDAVAAQLAHDGITAAFCIALHGRADIADKMPGLSRRDAAVEAFFRFFN